VSRPGIPRRDDDLCPVGGLQLGHDHHVGLGVEPVTACDLPRVVLAAA